MAITVGAILGATALIMIGVMWVYFDVTIAGIGTNQDFDDINDIISENQLQRDLQINGIRDIYDGTIARIDTQFGNVEQRITALEQRPTIDTVVDPTPEVVSVASDLELESYADAALNFQTNTFHKGDQVSLRAYNDNLNNKALFYVTDPNGVTTEPKELGTNQGYFQWVYEVPEFALQGNWTITLEIGDKVDAINISVVE